VGEVVAQALRQQLEGKRVLVLGLGVSGRSAAHFCAQQGARVVAADERELEELPELAGLAPGIEVQSGGTLPDPADFDLVVPSPGIPRERYAGRARRVWGDIELAAQALRIPIIAVTGTNGKSTTVLLIEALLRAAGLRARAAGNLGTPALSLVGEPLDWAVLEVSSFQLESVESFRPRVAVVLNLTPDHLDRHGDFESYVASKRRILATQHADDVAVLNFDDPVVRKLAERAPGRTLPFRRGAPCTAGAWLDGGAVVLRDASGIRRLALDGFGLEGAHNLDNALAALCAVWGAGIDPERGLGALASFRGLPHRCERVATLDGVCFINDSKATNPGAAARSLETATRPVLWIAGGRDKGLDFDALADAASSRVRTAFLIGESAPLLERALSGRVPVEHAADVEDAVRRAAAQARPRDVVLLAPGCASFDQAASFEERGERFRAAVARLAEEGPR